MGPFLIRCRQCSMVSRTSQPLSPGIRVCGWWSSARHPAPSRCILLLFLLSPPASTSLSSRLVFIIWSRGATARTRWRAYRSINPRVASFLMQRKKVRKVQTDIVFFFNKNLLLHYLWKNFRIRRVYISFNFIQRNALNLCDYLC